LFPRRAFPPKASIEEARCSPGKPSRRTLAVDRSRRGGRRRGCGVVLVPAGPSARHRRAHSSFGPFGKTPVLLSFRAARWCDLPRCQGYTWEVIIADTKWMIKGREFVNCNCSYGCPCQFNGLPTHGNCQAVGGFQIDQGYHGSTKLDDLKFCRDFPLARRDT